MVSTLQQHPAAPRAARAPGLEVAAHYHIASADEVGGDFYDLFPLSADRWGILPRRRVRQGRACAAALTSLARYTLRAAAVYDPDPVAVLDNLNTVLNTGEFRPRPPVLHGALRDAHGASVAGGYTVTLASGGHPSALLLRADGTADYLLHARRAAHRRPARDPDIATTTVHLDARRHPAAVHRRAHRGPPATSSGQRYGEEALLAFADVLAPTTPDALIDALAELLDGFGEGLDDDTAVMALGVPSRTAQGDGSSIASAVTPTS